MRYMGQYNMKIDYNKTFQWQIVYNFDKKVS